jgi:hypothetical protein
MSLTPVKKEATKIVKKAPVTSKLKPSMFNPNGKEG